MLTDIQCNNLWSNASPDNPIVIDSDEGKQVMDWVEKINKTNFTPNRDYLRDRFDPFFSPIDHKMINDRKQLAKHNHKHNVEQVGNEYIDNAHKYK